MNRSSRKQQQRAAYEAEMERRRQAIKNPALSEKELDHFRKTCDRYFAAYEAVSKPASIAIKPPHDAPMPLTHTGAPFRFSPDEEWPAIRGKPLAGVLEIFIAELPEIPKPLMDSDLLQVFLELTPGDPIPRYTGGSWNIRLGKFGDADQPQNNGPQIDESIIGWQRIEHDIPTYPDDLDLIDEELRASFEALPNSSALFVDRFRSGLSTRVGGWPQWVSNGGNVGEFCIQLNEDVIPVDFGFDGGLYFGKDKDSGEWLAVWEIG